MIIIDTRFKTVMSRDYDIALSFPYRGKPTTAISVDLLHFRF